MSKASDLALPMSWRGTLCQCRGIFSGCQHCLRLGRIPHQFWGIYGTHKAITGVVDFMQASKRAEILDPTAAVCGMNFYKLFAMSIGAEF